MTVEDLVNYYKSLIILQYRNKPKVLDTIDAFVRPTAMDLLPQAVNDAFNLDSAIGVQLDTLGKYIGVTRKINTFTQLIILSDSDYRTLLKIKRALNSIGSSLSDIQSFIVSNLNRAMFVIDNANMSMSFFFDSSLITLDLVQALIRQGLLPKPMGVNTNLIVYIPNTDKLYGWISYGNQLSSGITGFNNYTSYINNTPWLSYGNVL